ncbi:hypothetical protein [Pseudomonas sp. Irchel s3a12]|jgi:hypothetical protein|uniref:hypothetical protein n=1 Tax=Pseudomonas sp. Irchel s3a12 TaxID=2009047 RepID=UPI000BA3D2AF|nr:hypothetical protein [Pseudomonas sp. Irchel s3a12]
MPSAFTAKEIKAITSIIREWPLKKKLTWEAICEASQSALGFVPTRQALAGKALVVNAYKVKKAEIISDRDRTASMPLPKSLTAAAEQILRLQEENKRLKNELQLMAETAQIFIHNAALNGLTRDKLMNPIPRPDRKG